MGSTCTALQQGESWSHRMSTETGFLTCCPSTAAQRTKTLSFGFASFTSNSLRWAYSRKMAGSTGSRWCVTFVALCSVCLSLWFLPIWSVLTHSAIWKWRKTNCTAISQAKLPILTLHVCETKCVTTHCCWHSVMSTWDQAVNPGAKNFFYFFFTSSI